MQTSEAVREQMIEQQIRPWDVLDSRVLETLRSIRREAFVPDEHRALAFVDTEVPLPHGEHMLAPKLEGRLLQALALTREDSVLQIGTGSGFVTACLGRLTARVVSYEIHEDLAAVASDRLREQGCHGNIEVVAGDIRTKKPVGEFDAIAVCGSVAEYRREWTGLLKPGGRLFVVTGAAPIMEARLLVRSGTDDFREESLFDTMIAPLHGFEAQPGFAF